VRIIASIPGRLPAGADAGFDPEFPPTDPESEACRLRLKNLNQLLHFDVADSAISPTHWRLTARVDARVKAHRFRQVPPGTQSPLAPLPASITIR
jgi:hypothetical protein